MYDPCNVHVCVCVCALPMSCVLRVLCAVCDVKLLFSLFIILFNGVTARVRCMYERTIAAGYYLVDALWDAYAQYLRHTFTKVPQMEKEVRTHFC